jgi:hypothetical protein
MDIELVSVSRLEKETETELSLQNVGFLTKTGRWIMSGIGISKTLRKGRDHQEHL